MQPYDFPFPGPWPYEGTILRRDDPEGLGRVIAEIPGEIDETDWLFPVGQPKAGVSLIPDEELPTQATRRSGSRASDSRP